MSLRWTLTQDDAENWYLIPSDMLPNFRSCNEDASPAHDPTYRLYRLQQGDKQLEDLTFTDPRFDI